ncbi:MAG TPA: N-6 DNA methylase [Vicinamibacterales bacterium]|nr:N-6 DNA methylase [Vicinamibacterales bacterium]
MLPGLSGHLVSSAFLEADIASAIGTTSVDTARSQLARLREACAGLGPASSARAVLETAATPLAALLGFDAPSDLETTDSALVATIRSGLRPVAMIVVPWATSYDPLWRLAVTCATRRSTPWCFVFDGVRLRIVDGVRLYARRYLEVDLDLAADQPTTFAAFWRTCHASHTAADVNDPQSLHALVAASDRHAAGVCRSLRDGVLVASAEILRAMAVRRRRGSGDRDLDAAFEQALTIVYRILFLLFAEARALVPLWHPVYRESYSVESMRDQAERPTPTAGLWDALRAIARLAHSGCRAGDLRVTAFNGRLFAPARTPLADRRDLDEDAAKRAVAALSTRPAADGAGRERIAYRDLGVEQLGAVYETLLDYRPAIDNGRVDLRSGSGIRKATGTFYTPQPIAEYLVRRTLGPLVRQRSASEIMQLRLVDPAMGSGAFLVAACRYLAAAYEAALVRDGGCHASDIDEPQRAAIRRSIAERCLYGVDLNPMAVQLARLSLWLATLAADRPLSFLDHRLQAGDSLLGTWIAHLRTPTAANRHARRREPLPLFTDDDIAPALRDALPIRFSLESSPNDTVDQVRHKERALAALMSPDSALARWKLVAHVWCAPWFAGDDGPPASAFGALSDAALKGEGALPPKTARRFLDAATALGDSLRLFHWELEFPEVFFDADGRRSPRPGFDAVVGNPPWDMIRADAGEADARSRNRSALAPVLRFTRDAGVYTAQSDGHANRYQLFVERAIALTRPGGRFGLVLPSGLATDHGSAALRRFLLSRCDVDAIVGMDNHRGVFPIHRSVRFLLVTATSGSATGRIAYRLGIDDPAALDSLENEAGDLRGCPVHLSPALLERLSGPTITIPYLRTATDLTIVERAATLFRPLGSGDGWAARFGRELNATDDRDSFRDGREGLLVVDGRHLEPFRVSLDGVRRSIGISDARRLLRSDRHDRARLAYRDVASATNRVTLIAAVLPRGVVSTHTVFCLRTPLPLTAHYFLCGMFNSLVVNYLVRMRVTTHVTTAVVERLPLPMQEQAPAVFDEIASLARALERRFDSQGYARLNARVAHLYQLSVDEFRHVLDTFPLVPLDGRRLALSVFNNRG